MTRPSEWFRGKPPWTLPMIVLGVLVGVVFIGVILSLTFAGCAAQPGTGSEAGTPAQNNSVQGLTEKTVTLSDGRIITCIVYKYGSAGGISCDWARAEGTE